MISRQKRIKICKRTAGRCNVHAGNRGRLALLLMLALVCVLVPSSMYALANGQPEYLCGHVHDTATCGYSVSDEPETATGSNDQTDAVSRSDTGSAGTPCSHICHILSFADNIPGKAYKAFTVADGKVRETAAAEPDGNSDPFFDETTGNTVEDDSNNIDTADGKSGTDSTLEEPQDEPQDESQDEPQGETNTETADDTDDETATEIKALTYEDICAVLPATLAGTLACAEGSVDIPVTWSCANYSDQAGAYIFRAEPANEHCDYAAADDVQTPDINESELPFVTVTIPAEQMTEPTDCYTLSDAVYPVVITSAVPLPQGAYLVVKEVAHSTAQELLGTTETQILLAYDIKIMVPGEPEATEYQPPANSPVTVTIMPPAETPLVSEVEVVHLAEDKTTGEITPETVAAVTTTDSGAVQFIAESFSMFVIKLPNKNTPFVVFNYDDSKLNVKYCTSQNGTYNDLTKDVVVNYGETLYFKIIGDSATTVLRDGSTPLIENNSVYIVENITANTTITIGTLIELDITHGSIVIGGGTYTYYDSNLTKQNGIHVEGNIYKISGTTGNQSSGGETNVTLTGAGDFNVILNNVNIYTGTPGTTGLGVCAPVSTDGVTNGTINIILNGTNILKNVSADPGSSYAALEKDANPSTTLVINGSGSLTATGGADSAGIGGSDMGTDRGATRNITINGGNITANTAGSQGAGIGSGNNKKADNIIINGGDITATAYANANGAAIGGSGGITADGEAGEVTINGGNVSANGNGNGAGIGGGGAQSDAAKGGNGTVTITGGTIEASSIGGGSTGGSGTGGNATVNISGGTVTTTGDIGGGDSNSNTGGTATVTISGGIVTVQGTDSGISGGDSGSSTAGNVTVNITGGTVVTPHISGGLSGGAGGTYKDATVSIAAASVNIGDRANITSITGPDPNNSYVSTVVYNNIIDISQIAAFSGSGSAANIAVTKAVLSDNSEHTLIDVKTDANGKLYLWLPNGYSVKSIEINSISYTLGGTLVTSATIQHDSSTVGSVLRAVLNNGTAAGYQWQWLDGDNWTNILGAINVTYTVAADDVSKKIRVVITDSSSPSNQYPSGAVLITSTSTPYAQITYSSLEAGSTLTANLLNSGAGAGTLSYQWSRNTGGNSDPWNNIYNATSSTYPTVSDDIGCYICVTITDNSTNDYTSTAVRILAPTISVTVPLSTVVTIDPEGICSVSPISNNIKNYSSVIVYVTEVAFTWNAEASRFFYDYALVEALLTLGNSSPPNNHTFKGISPAVFKPYAQQGKIIAKTNDTPGSLNVDWTFALGTLTGGGSNYIKKAVAAGEETQVATITYTIDYNAPEP